MPVANIKMRESLYLFKSGFKPVWEDRRNIKGGSWTFRVPKTSGPDFWTHVQMLAIGEQLEESLAEGTLRLLFCDNSSLSARWLEELPCPLFSCSFTNSLSLPLGDQLCGVGLSVRFNSHLITIWHRDASKQASIDGMLACVLADIPAELRPRPDNYFYKKHSEHAGFKVPPELQHLVDGGVKTGEASPTA